MITGPKYKKARRLGPAVFDKTQTQKFVLSEGRRGKPKDAKHPRQKTDYGNQMLEKQKARVTYGVKERQFVKYVRESMAKKGAKPQDELYARLEKRLDNIIYRLGFAPTRQASRQMVAHGHIVLNGKKVTIPSYLVSEGEKIAIREGSKKSMLFATLDEKLKTVAIPAWLKINIEKKEAEVQGIPKPDTGVPFSLASIIEFYSR